MRHSPGRRDRRHGAALEQVALGVDTEALRATATAAQCRPQAAMSLIDGWAPRSRPGGEVLGTLATASPGPDGLAQMPMCAEPSWSMTRLPAVLEWCQHLTEDLHAPAARPP